MSRLSTRSLLCIVVLVAALSAHARVFQRWGSAANSDRALRNAGATVAYEAPIEVNGASANLTLYSFEDSIGTVFTHLRKTFALAEDVFDNGELGFASVREAGRVIRLLVFYLVGEDRTLLFKIDQSEKEYDAAQQGPTSASVAGLPPYPGSEPMFSASDKAAAMSIAISQTAADAGSVHTFFDSALQANNWKPALPEAARTSESGLAVYLKVNQVFCLLIDNDSNSTANRITLLHKSLRLE